MSLLVIVAVGCGLAAVWPSRPLPAARMAALREGDGAGRLPDPASRSKDSPAISAPPGAAPAAERAPIWSLRYWRGMARWLSRSDPDPSTADQLPEAVELVALAAGAGLHVSRALEIVGGRLPAPLGPDLETAARLGLRSGRLADELDALADRRPAVQPLTSVLAASLRYGQPVVPALERVSVEVRHLRRRRAEAAARRLPVKMLFPLVTCSLPGFALLTVVPLVAGSLQVLAG